MEESIGYLMKKAQAALQRTIDSQMSALDLTALQWAPLLFISLSKTSSTAADLSRCLGVETSSMTRMLDRLENKGCLPVNAVRMTDESFFLNSQQKRNLWYRKSHF